jgi:hypothetical protein
MGAIRASETLVTIYKTTHMAPERRRQQSNLIFVRIGKIHSKVLLYVDFKSNLPIFSKYYEYRAVILLSETPSCFEFQDHWKWWLKLNGGIQFCDLSYTECPKKMCTHKISIPYYNVYTYFGDTRYFLMNNLTITCVTIFWRCLLRIKVKAPIIRTK